MKIAPVCSFVLTKCPEAVRELAEIRSSTNAPRVPKTVTRPALRENLLLMAKQDQDARAFPISSGGHIDPVSPEVMRMREVDSANLKRLKHIVNQDGFPTAELRSSARLSVSPALNGHRPFGSFSAVAISPQGARAAQEHDKSPHPNHVREFGPLGNLGSHCS